MADPQGLRVSDQQREQAAQAIREHFAAGRLTEDELNERVQAALQARTDSELAALMKDLPALPVSQRERQAELAQRRARLQRRVLQEVGGGVVVFAVCTAIWLASGAHGQFWPIWVALVAVLALARSSWRLYGPAPDLEQVERDLDRRQRSHGDRRSERYRRRSHRRM
jgi:Domain of unknown function (DUF1707)